MLTFFSSCYFEEDKETGSGQLELALLDSERKIQTENLEEDESPQFDIITTGSDRDRIAAESGLFKREPGNLIYQFRSQFDSTKSIVQSSEIGTLRSDDIQMAARPYGKLAREKGYLYHEGSYALGHEDGTETRHYEIRREEGFLPKPPPERKTSISSRLKSKLKNLDAQEKITVVVGLKGIDEWNIDLLPPRHLVSVSDWVLAENTRKAQIASTTEASVGGKCVSYDLINAQVAGNSIMVNTFCYYTTVEDNEPN